MWSRKNVTALGLIMCLLCVVGVLAYTQFASVSRNKTSGTTGAERVAVEDTSAEEDVNVLQSRESARIFEKFSYASLSSDPKRNADLLIPVLKRELSKRPTTVMSLKDIQDACAQLGLVLAGENGMPREAYKKHVAHLKISEAPSVVFIDERAGMQLEEQFNFSYDKRLAENPKLIGMCLDTGRIIVHSDYYQLGADIAFEASTYDLPGFYTASSITQGAFIFHQDPTLATVPSSIRVPSLFVSIPVKDDAGNMYPLCITLQKNPKNNFWVLDRAYRTVNVEAYKLQQIVY
jgi:hypothetical protein